MRVGVRVRVGVGVGVGVGVRVRVGVGARARARVRVDGGAHGGMPSIIRVPIVLFQPAVPMSVCIAHLVRVRVRVRVRA